MEACQLDENPIQEKYSIYFLCGNNSSSSKVTTDLSKEGTLHLITPIVSDSETLLLPSADPHMIILYYADRERLYRALTKIGEMRANNYQGVVAVLTDEPCVEDLLRSLHQGVDEYFYNGPKLQLLFEVQRMLAVGRQQERSSWHPEQVSRSGLFRSVGLTPCQVEILAEFTKDFPRLRTLSQRTNKSEASLRKSFSLIYDKLRVPFAVETQGQLSQLLTICAAVGPSGQWRT